MASLEAFTKNIRLKFDADKTSLQKIAKDIDQLGQLELFSDEEVKAIHEQLKGAQSLKNQLSELQTALSTVENLTGKEAESIQKKLKAEIANLKKRLNESVKDSTGDRKSIGEHLKEKLKEAKDDFLNSFTDKVLGGLKKVFENAWKELKNVISFSRMSNSETRDLMLGYGFSGSQAYGWTKAMGALGFNSEEDLMYASTEELTMFREAFNKYSDKYNKLYDDGTFKTMREFEVEMAEFKEDMTLEVVQFFMDNKDGIKKALLALIDLSEFVIGTIGKFFNLMSSDGRSSSERAAATASIIRNYSNINNGTNVRIDNTFNNVAKSDQGWLINAGQMVIEPIIAALETKGG